jgi:hypothetical protein
MSIHYGNTVSRSIKLFVGISQGSLIAATIFRLHGHYLPQYFTNMAIHLFADNLAINIIGSIEKKFSYNIAELALQASIARDIQSKCSYDYILPVSIDKTNALLVHSIVARQYPVITHRNTKIKFVKKFKYLGVQITTKLGWSEYISHGLRRIRNIYNALRILLFRISLLLIKLRKVLFFAFALPRFAWIFSCIISKSSDKSCYYPMGLRKNNKFLKRLIERAKHTKIDLAEVFFDTKGTI